MVGLVAAAGRFTDWFSAERLWLLGLLIFAVTSVAAGFSPGIGWLIGIRAVQGVGAALIFPASVVLISETFTSDERGRAFGIFASCATTLLLIGPAVGGILTEFLSWRWVFWITTPAALLCIWRLRMPERKTSRAEQAIELDLPGLITLVVSVAAVSLALMQGAAWHWTPPTILILFAVGVVAGIFFVVCELRSDDPLIDLKLFRNPTAAICLLTLFMAQYRRVTTSIFIALFLRDSLGFSPLTAGIALVPSFVLLPLTTVVIGRLADRWGARVVIFVGIIVLTAAAAWISLAVDLENYWVLFPALVLFRAAAPSLFGPARKAMTSALPINLHAQVSGLSVTAQMIGGTLAISIGRVLLALSGGT